MARAHTTATTAQLEVAQGKVVADAVDPASALVKFPAIGRR